MAKGGKQKAADEAYRNAEAQRALVKVLAFADDMAHGEYGYVEPEVLDAIERVRAHFLKVSEPPKVKTLAGQIDLVDGSVEGDTGEIERDIAGVPVHCPGCGQNMTVVYGGNWTPMYKSDDEDFGKLQCGTCARILTVTAAVWDRVRDLRRRTIGAADVAPVKAERRKKERGAG